MAVKKTATTLQEARQLATDLSKEGNKESYIILSNGLYYIEDESPLVRVWEELTATYKDGELINE